jgi:hypothetical protein
MNILPTWSSVGLRNWSIWIRVIRPSPESVGLVSNKKVVIIFVRVTDRHSWLVIFRGGAPPYYKKHGGAHTTHNTPDCRKYDSNGTPKSSFKGRKPNGNSRGPERPAQWGSSYAQLSAKIDKLTKSNKKMKRAIGKKKRKHHNMSDSDDSG